MNSHLQRVQTKTGRNAARFHFTKRKAYLLALRSFASLITSSAMLRGHGE